MSAAADRTCQRCGRSCEVWFAPNDVWNAVIGGYEGLRCVRCFIADAEAAGWRTSAWLVMPEPPFDAVVRFREGVGWMSDTPMTEEFEIDDDLHPIDPQRDWEGYALALQARLRAVEDLLICYRTGGSFSGRLLRELDRTRHRVGRFDAAHPYRGVAR